MGYTPIIDVFLSILEPLFPYTFDLVLGPLLGVGSPLMGARITVAVTSLVLSALLSLIYYVLIDIEEYERMKEKRKSLNEKMQDKKGDDPDAVGEHFKEMADMQKEFFSIMLKPMIVSMFLFFFLLPWMYATFQPIAVAAPANSGYAGTLQYNGYAQDFTVTGNTSQAQLTVDGDTYAVGEFVRMDKLDWKVKGVSINEEADTAEASFAAVLFHLPFGLPLVGKELGWLGTYILVSIPFTYLFRKKLGIQ